MCIPLDFGPLRRIRRQSRQQLRHRYRCDGHALVGGTTWVIDTAVFLLLKATVLDTKPLTAKVIAVLIALTGYGQEEDLRRSATAGR